MCTDADFDKIEVTERDIVAYKVVAVAGGKLVSEYRPQKRALQDGWKGKGRIKTYKIGNKYKSSMPKTPGIYCYANAPMEPTPSIYKTLRVRIPAGTRIVQGFYGYGGSGTINAEQIIILGQY